jgi:hypothetical protein
LQYLVGAAPFPLELEVPLFAVLSLLAGEGVFVAVVIAVALVVVAVVPLAVVFGCTASASVNPKLVQRIKLHSF